MNLCLTNIHFNQINIFATLLSIIASFNTINPTNY